ncbi:hypothetical protein [Nostoc sp.]|uniref:hypothetical protein n=1 Tax=Nostoc sp. TaxID=1180 RepID=UPI002FFB755A
MKRHVGCVTAERTALFIRIWCVTTFRLTHPTIPNFFHKSNRIPIAEEDNELYPVDARDKVYSNNFWARFVGQRISNITILKRSYSSALYAHIANEIGLLFEVEDGSRFILSHGLHADSDDFSVIQESQIDNEIRNEIQGL